MKTVNVIVKHPINGVTNIGFNLLNSFRKKNCQEKITHDRCTNNGGKSKNLNALLICFILLNLKWSIYLLRYVRQNTPKLSRVEKRIHTVNSLAFVDQIFSLMSCVQINNFFLMFCVLKCRLFLNPQKHIFF